MQKYILTMGLVLMSSPSRVQSQKVDRRRLTLVQLTSNYDGLTIQDLRILPKLARFMSIKPLKAIEM